jgi:hypothetical protein
MISKQEEEDLALALALSNSLSSSQQHCHESCCSDPPTDSISDDQALAFFTDLPINHNHNNHTNSSSSSSRSGERLCDTRSCQHTSSSISQTKATVDADMGYARRLQAEEDARQRSEDKRQLANDEQFAKELCDDEKRSHWHIPTTADAKAESKTDNQSTRSSYTILGRHSHVCSYCKKSLVGQYKVVEKQLNLHHECFLCAGCNHPIIENSYVKKGSLAANTIEFYHTTCNTELFAPNCDLCGDKLTGQYNTHGFFSDKQKFCASHDIHRDHRSCTSCNLIEPVANSANHMQSHNNNTGKSTTGEVFNTLPDGRAICPDCVSYIILESNEAKDLYLEAVSFMENTLGLSIPPYMREVPILAVDLPSLNDQSQLNRHLCAAHPPVQLSSGGGGGSSADSAAAGTHTQHTSTHTQHPLALLLLCLSVCMSVSSPCPVCVLCAGLATALLYQSYSQHLSN